MTAQTTATLTIDQLTTNNGYAIINMGQTEIIQTTKTILHIINTEEIRQTINTFVENTRKLKVDDDPIIKRQIGTLYAKVTAIEPGKRQKRGLVNIIGTGQKWLFGTMDDSDRQEIADHLNTLGKNQENIASHLNQQIEINGHLSESISYLKSTIESDRKELSKSYVELTENERRFILQQLKLDQLVRLRMLEEHLNQLIDNIALVKHGLIHPSLLTTEEINETGLDFYKLKNAKAGLLKYSIDTLVLAIKIPDKYQIVNLKLITAIPTGNKTEIEEDDHYFLEANNTKFEFLNNVQYAKDLKPLRSCIVNKNCKTKQNELMEINEIDDTTIICKNLRDQEIINNCDDRKIKLSGNYLIVINNCSIKIMNKTFSNSNVKFKERFYYYDEINYNFTKNLSFEDVIIRNIENLKHINLLKIHRNVSYSAISAVTCILIIIIIFILKLVRRNKNLTISIKTLRENNHPTHKTQESFDLKGGEVTYPKHSLSRQSIFST